MARNSLIYLLQGLQLLINIKKSTLKHTQRIEFLVMEIDALEMTLKIPWAKKDQVVDHCQIPGEAISYHKGVEAIDKSSAFHSHCNFPSTYSVLCNAEATNLEVISR